MGAFHGGFSHKKATSIIFSVALVTAFFQFYPSLSFVDAVICNHFQMLEVSIISGCAPRLFLENNRFFFFSIPGSFLNQRRKLTCTLYILMEECAEL